MLRLADVDTINEQTPSSNPAGPEQGAPPRPEPDVAAKRDLIHPEQPEVGEPHKPMPDMDPDGQDPDENETIN